VVGIMNDERNFGVSCRSCDLVEQGRDVARSFYGRADPVVDFSKGSFQGRRKVSRHHEGEWVLVYSGREGIGANRNYLPGSMEIVVDVYFALRIRPVSVVSYLEINVRVYAFVLERHGLDLSGFVDGDEKTTR
jgi:hypothetical protein